MDPLQALPAGELVEVAPDGVAGDAEHALQVGRDDAALGAQDVEDALLALLLEHHGSSSTLVAISLPAARASATISSAPVEAPPTPLGAPAMRSTASQRLRRRRAIGWKISSNAGSPTCALPACSISGSASASPVTGRCPRL